MAALAPIALNGHIPNFKRRWALPWKANGLLDGTISPNLIAFPFYAVALHVSYLFSVSVFMTIVSGLVEDFTSFSRSGLAREGGTQARC